MLIMPKPKHRDMGFTLVELSVAIMLLSLIAGMPLSWFMKQQQDQNRSIEMSKQREAQLRGLSLIGKWIEQASRVRPAYGSVRTDVHTLILEVPNTDSLGYRTDAMDIVTLRWDESNRLDLAILPGSGSPRKARAFSPPGHLGEVSFHCLDDSGMDTSYAPERAKGVQVLIAGGPSRLFTLGTSEANRRDTR
ncbi:hypothetical protein D3C72_319550 [compost metagenome]